MVTGTGRGKGGCKRQGINRNRVSYFFVYSFFSLPGYFHTETRRACSAEKKQPGRQKRSLVSATPTKAIVCSQFVCLEQSTVSLAVAVRGIVSSFVSSSCLHLPPTQPFSPTFTPDEQPEAILFGDR